MTRAHASPASGPTDVQLDSLSESMASSGARARLILTLVGVFAVAYVAVIGMKIQRDRLGLEYEMRLDQVSAAELASAEMAARTAFVRGAVLGAASGVQTDWQRDTNAVTQHLSALAARPEILSAALVTSSGDPLAATQAADAGTLAQALKARGARGVWVAPGSNGEPTLYAAADLALNNEVHVLVSRVSAEQLTVARDRFALVDAAGRSIMPQRDIVIDSPEVFAEILTDRAMATTLAADGESGRMLVSAAPVGGVGGAYVLTSSPMNLADQNWRRTLIFYLLLLFAPILVAVGLCAVLLMQIDNVQSTRRKLIDSERRFRLAVEGARCGVWDWDLEANSVYITASLARMLGERQTQVLSREQFRDLVHEQDREKLELAIRNASRIGQVDVEFRAANRPCSLHARGRPWLASGERHSNRVVGVAIDVTEKHGARSRILQAEGQLEAALNSITESFALWDADRRLVLSNPRFGQFFRLNERQTRRGASYDDFEMTAAGAIKRLRPQNEQGLTEMELNDGTWLLVSDRPTEDGGMVSIGADITTLKRQEQRLTENDQHLRQTIKELGKTKERLEDAKNQAALARTRAEEASRSKTEFLANMSHELRTPLNAIIGFSEIMQNEMFGALGDPRYKEYMKDIWTSGQHLLQLISDILDMSKIEAGKMSLSYERVFPHELAEQCARLIRARAKSAELVFDVVLSDMPEIMADPRALKQVLLNLLSNAVKFTKPGGSVELRGRGDETGVTFEVADTGVGIAKAHMGRLGRPFEQIESHRAKTHPGAGLGLALSKTLTELHGGVLVIESELNVGTTVSVWIPRTPPAKKAGGGREALTSFADDAQAAVSAAPDRSN